MLSSNFSSIDYFFILGFPLRTTLEAIRSWLTAKGGDIPMDLAKPV